MARTVVLWRHGQTAWNAANRFQGQTDVPLDELGSEQAASAAAALAKRTPSLIVSSDLARALATARELATRTGLPVIADTALREADAGRWEGMTHQEILTSDASSFDRWRSDIGFRPGGSGETRAEVAQRAAAAVIRHTRAMGDGQTAVIVTHGGAARAAVGHLLGLEPMQWQRMAVLSNCGWAELEVDGGDRWRLRAYNLTW